MRNHTFRSENLKGRDQLDDLDVKGRVWTQCNNLLQSKLSLHQTYPEQHHNKIYI